MEESAKPASNKSKVFGARLLSTLVLWALVAGVFIWGNPYGVGAAIGLLGMLGLWEWRLLWKAERDDWCLLWMCLVGLGYTAWAVWWLGARGAVGPDGEWVAVLLVTMGAFCIRFRKAIEGREAIGSVLVSVFGLIYLGLMFSGSLMRLVAAGPEVRDGLWFLLVVLVGTKFTDMGAYLVGSLIGKHKMVPHISPGKTWEGFFGALLIGQGGVWGVKALAGPHLDWVPGGWLLALLGLILSLGAVAGDLAESLFKRSLAAKDSGRVLPGIGGVLDLVDSICFTGPLAWIFLKLFV
ncbi:MAG: phosphatidate cytidylyltransferase [Verrucomicrobiota bacterium JB023]|nr:phosphatidate cytidylyltransferase [Verrucomicrobiota bacterium JB023]